MLRRKWLRYFVVSAVVLTIAGIGFSKKSPVSGPVQQMDYDVTTDVVLGMPDGLPPLTSFEGALRKNVALPADLSTFPPNPCAGIASVWNGILADATIHEHTRKQALGVVLQSMALSECPAQIVRDESVSPPKIVSITPISAL